MLLGKYKKKYHNSTQWAFGLIYCLTKGAMSLDIIMRFLKQPFENKCQGVYFPQRLGQLVKFFSVLEDLNADFIVDIKNEY